MSVEIKVIQVSMVDGAPSWSAGVPVNSSIKMIPLDDLGAPGEALIAVKADAGDWQTDYPVTVDLTQACAGPGGWTQLQQLANHYCGLLKANK